MKVINLFLPLFFLACARAPSVPREYTVDLLDVEYVIFDTREGIYPNHALILENPNNPYAQLEIRLNDDNKFSYVFRGNNAARFYAWATALNFAGANGEEQFRVGQRLVDLAAEETADPLRSATLLNMAREAYVACYDFFFYENLDAGEGRREQVGFLAFRQLTDTNLFNTTDFEEFSGRVTVTTNPDGQNIYIKEKDLRGFDRDARDEEERN